MLGTMSFNEKNTKHVTQLFHYNLHSVALFKLLLHGYKPFKINEIHFYHNFVYKYNVMKTR